MRFKFFTNCMAMERSNHFRYTWHLIKTDMARFGHHTNLLGVLRIFSPYSFSFKVTFWYRIGHYLTNCGHPILRKCLLPAVRWIHQHNSYRTGIQLPFRLEAGEGLLFGHFSCIIINGHTVIGNHVTISQGVTLGNNFSKGSGAPVIGDNCVLGPGCKVLGPIEIGHHSFVGANAVITRSFPENSVLGGANLLLGTNGNEVVKLYS